MPLKFHLPPAVTYRKPDENPAEGFVTTGNLEFGITIPKYNGTEITGLQQNHTTSPTVTNTQGAFPMGGVNYNAHGVVTVLPTHNIAWPIFLPPDPAKTNGMWTAKTKINGRDLKQKLQIVLLSRQEVGKPLSDGVLRQLETIPARSMFTVHIKPMPTPKEYMEHILNHELQHAADHRWLAERIIGWWDEWLNELVTGNIHVMSKEGLGGLGISAGFGYATGDWRIISYWCKAAAQSGDLYHGTKQGTRAKLNIEEITGDSVTMTVTPREIIRVKPDLNKPKPHQEMTFTAWNLNGNEAALKHGAAPKNPFDDKHWNKIDATHWARK